MNGRRNWKKSLKPEERDELVGLDQRIRLQKVRAEARRRSIKEQEKLFALKWQRKMLQNRVSIRTRRLVEATA